jgi:hypothetical protein
MQLGSYEQKQMLADMCRMKSSSYKIQLMKYLFVLLFTSELHL